MSITTINLSDDEDFDEVEFLDSATQLASMKLKEEVREASYNVFETHDKSTLEELYMAIGQTYVNDLFIDAMELAIELHKRAQEETKDE